MGIQFRTGRRANAVATALLLSVATQAGVAWAPPTDVGDAFTRDVTTAGVPGAVMARIDHGRVVETRAVGDVTATSRFLWGSVSKPVAGAVLAHLVDQHRLTLDEQASTLAVGLPGVPIQDLLNHTAGLGFGAEVLDVDRADTTAAAVAAQHPEQGRSGSAYAYSSLGYLYLQAVVEKAAGTSYEQAVRRRYPRTHIGASAASCADVTRPHRFAGPWAVPAPRHYDGAGAAYGYTCGSIDDLAAVAVHHLEQPSVEHSVPTGHPGQRYANGWNITTEPDGRSTHWHLGTVPGYFSAIYLDHTSRDGVVTLMDASGHLHEEQLAAVTRATFDRATGRPAEAIPDAFDATAYPTTILAVAFALLLLALRQRLLHRRFLQLWCAAMAIVGLAIVAMPRLTGYPYRYIWLWEPSLAIAALAVGASLSIGLATSLLGSPSRHMSGRNGAIP